LNSTATLVTYTLYPDNSTTALWSDTLDTNIPIRTGQELACAITATSAISGVDICWLDYISFKLPKERVID
jgi:spore coat protein U-like protein